MPTVHLFRGLCALAWQVCFTLMSRLSPHMACEGLWNPQSIRDHQDAQLLTRKLSSEVQRQQVVELGLTGRFLSDYKATLHLLQLCFFFF